VPQDDTSFVGRTAHVTGWGHIYEGKGVHAHLLVSVTAIVAKHSPDRVRLAEGPLPSVLQEVSVPVINNSVCETMYHAAGYIEHIPNIFICAGWRKGGFDSCEV
jgi:hypothetical protein